MGSLIKVWQKSNMEALTTATCALWVGIVEDELRLDLIVYVVHLRAHQKHESLALHYDSNILVFHHLIQFAHIRLVSIVHDIAVAIAASAPHPNPDCIDLTRILLHLYQLLYPIRCRLSLFHTYTVILENT